METLRCLLNLERILMNIPGCDIYSSDEPYRMYIENAIATVINKSGFIGGVEKFEDNFAQYIGSDYCVSLSSCTAALHLAIETLEIKGKILVPAMTVTADAEAVLMAGCTPVFYDNDLSNLDKLPDDIKAIIVVHLYGNPVDMDKIEIIAKRNNLFIIEDCAQSTGATWKGKMTGTFGEVGCFSFFPTKVLGTYGDGGAIVTNLEAVAKKARALRNHGRLPRKKHEHQYSGYNYRLDGLKAAILVEKLRFLPEMIEKRRSAAAIYDKLIDKESLYKMNDGSVYYVYPILVYERDKLLKYLKKRDIGAGLHYPIPVHHQPAFRKYCCKDIHYAEYLSESEISLPISPGITGKQIEHVCKCVEKFYEKN